MKHIIYASLVLLFCINTALAQQQAPTGAQLVQQLLQQQSQTNAPPPINQYNPTYKQTSNKSSNSISKAKPISSKPANKSTSLLPTDKYNIYLLRNKADAEGIVTLRIEALKGIEGCAKASIPQATQKIKGKNLWITIQPVQTEINKNIRYPHYECQASVGVPSIDIDLNRDHLEDNNIEKIILESGNTKNKFTLQIDKNSLRLTPKNASIFTLTGPNTHYFYDPNTIILSAPAYNTSAPLAPQIQAIADKYGFKTAPYPNTKNFYFIDHKQRLTTRLSSKNTIKLDTIAIDDIFLGANGEYTVSRDIDVFASRPAEFD